MMRVREVVNRIGAALVALLCAMLVASPASAEDGYDLWLRYAPLDGASPARDIALRGFALEAEQTPTVDVAVTELQLALSRMARPDQRQGALHPQIIVGTLDRLSPTYSDVTAVLAETPSGSFVIGRSFNDRIVVAGRDDIGLLYGVFALTRHLAAQGTFADVEQFSVPAMPLRMLNHWDNPDGHVERGYAGRSIFDWWQLPEKLDPEMIDYARANASIGINGAVVNNVNASPLFLTDRYLPKLRRLADAWRPYGIRLYISARFSAPKDIGGLGTADPIDPAVRAWWQAKADEIYAEIPDFGGFLVKANSEGQPGPQDYGRTHADGANMLAAALGDRGTVIWRAFVYSAEDETDRAKQAYEEFVPLDGQFADNVIVQVKNGPVDFQPREPFHPMFGAMPNTKLMLEAQITREYLGQASGIAFLAPMWSEVLDAETGRAGTVAQVVGPVGMAGGANTGSDRNWTGTHFDQANWYAFGRLAWDPSLSPERIAREWAAQTFSRDDAFLAQVVPMMLASREAVADYMTPLGLAHQMATGHHYGPGPWVCDLPRPEWNPCYYHAADHDGIGFDRTATGSNALAQYAPEIAQQWADPATMDERYLLWFHHLPWNHRMQDGRTLWHAMIARYDRGVTEVDAMAQTWARLAAYVDPERHRAVSESLAIQQREARWWRDASIAYWRSLNRLPLPDGVRAPAHDLDYYRSLEFPEAPGK